MKYIKVAMFVLGLLPILISNGQTILTESQDTDQGGVITEASTSVGTVTNIETETSTADETTIETWTSSGTVPTWTSSDTVPTWTSSGTVSTWTSSRTASTWTSSGTVSTWTSSRTASTWTSSGTVSTWTSSGTASTWTSATTGTTISTGTRTNSVPNSSIIVTIITMSGLEDDFFTLTNSSDTQTVQAMLANLIQISPPDWPIFGFRGYALESQTIPSFPLYVRVFQGVIEISYGGDSYFYQDSRGLESFLKQKASSVGFQPTGNNVLVKRLARRQVRLLPVSGAEPAYAPNRWNVLPTRRQNNCYAYATNMMTNTFPQPGRASGVPPVNQQWPWITCPGYVAASRADGLVVVNCAVACPQGSFKVALVIKPKFPQDYHWFRQDSNGFWSHKPGQTAATNLDNLKNRITDPRIANRGPYTTFCECFCVQPNRVRIRDVSATMNIS